MGVKSGWLLLLFGCSLWASAAPDYQVTLDAEQGLIDVNACFSETPQQLIAGTRQASQVLSFATYNGKQLSASRNRLRLPNHEPGCLHYQVDLQQTAKLGKAWQKDRSWLVNNRIWLWQPQQQQALQLSFTLSGDSKTQALSVPWPQDPESNHFIVGESPHWWTSRMAFGELHRADIAVGDQQLRVAILGVNDKTQQQDLLTWVQQAASAVAAVGGRFPVDQAQVLVMPISRGRGPVPWAEVQRAGLPAVHLFVNPSQPLSAFLQDWTATHEFSHLLIPKVSYQDRWISEGLATYYQYLLMARADMLSEKTAWQRMQAGFNKGRRADKGDSLRDSRSTRHVYWGGAAIFLLADHQLREQGSSLDAVLAKLADCCLPNNDNWSAERFMQQLDKLSNTEVFTTLLQQQASQRQFPLSRQQEAGLNPFIKSPQGALLSD